MPRRISPVVIPTALLGLVAIGWSVFWWVSTGRLETAMDRWMAREAEAGRVYACAERDIGGFPFRIEVRCASPTAEVPVEGGTLDIAARSFVAVAQIYRPTHVIGQFEGPLTIERPGGVGVTADWSAAEASLVGTTEALERVSLVARDAVLEGEGGRLGATEILEVHARRAPGADAGAYDAVARLNGVRMPFTDALVGSAVPADAELQLSVSGLDRVSGDSEADRMRAFADAGGRVTVAMARLARGSLLAVAAGDVGIDPEGRPEGRFDLTMRGHEEIAGSLPGLGGAIAGALNVIGRRATLDGAPARSYEVVMEDGVLRVTGLAVARVPRLF